MHSTLSRPFPRLIRSVASTTAVLATALTIASCGAATSDTAQSPTSPATGVSGAAESAATPSAAALTLDSGWAKAGSGMTAVFGTVVNHAAEPVTIVGGSSSWAATVEVHTMVKQPDGSMKMTKMKDGLAIPAGGSAALAPGADHIMLIDLKAPLTNGEQVTIVMATAGGASFEWTVPVRSFAGAEETYVPEDH
jgi:hypothetical protein